MRLYVRQQYPRGRTTLSRRGRHRQPAEEDGLMDAVDIHGDLRRRPTLFGTEEIIPHESAHAIRRRSAGEGGT